MRLKLEVDDYVSNQDATLRELRKKLTYQKSEDIMEDMEQEMKNLKTQAPEIDSPAAQPITITPPVATPSSPQSGSVFDAMESELEEVK